MWLDKLCYCSCEHCPQTKPDHPQLTEQAIMRMADAMADSGMAAAGYEYINLDDCCSSWNRTADGKRTWNHGMPTLVDCPLEEHEIWYLLGALRGHLRPPGRLPRALPPGRGDICLVGRGFPEVR